LLSSMLNNSQGNGGIEVQTPALGFIISGGHTELILVKNFGEYVLLGQTLDDAAGEAYDKVARMLQLGYPGGPILAEMAKEGNPIYPLPEPMLQRHDLHFSFSGLKTAAMVALKKLENVPHNRQFIADFSASFETAVLKHLTRKFEKAIGQYQPKMILLGGGVVSNMALRKAIRTIAKKYNLSVGIPYSKKLVTDNAAMIGLVGYLCATQNRIVPNALEIDRMPNLNFPYSD